LVDCQHKNNHLDYFYAGNQPNLTAPTEVGEYDVLYFTSNKKVLAKSSFHTTPVTASLSVPDNIAAGSSFDVTYTGPDNKGDQIVILPKGSTDSNNHLDYFYAGNNPDLTAPEKIGEYDILYFTSDKKVLAKDTFTVTPVTASLSVPETVVAETNFIVTYEGPNNQGDWIVILPKGSTDANNHLDYFYAGNRAELTAPKELGEYDVLYFTKKKNILAKDSFTVTN
jgi:Ca-activated chloride channel family protein